MDADRRGGLGNMQVKRERAIKFVIEMTEEEAGLLANAIDRIQDFWTPPINVLEFRNALRDVYYAQTGERLGDDL